MLRQHGTTSTVPRTACRPASSASLQADSQRCAPTSGDAYRTLQRAPPAQNAGTFRVVPAASLKATSRVTSLKGSACGRCAVKTISVGTFASVRHVSAAEATTHNARKAAVRPKRLTNLQVFMALRGNVSAAPRCGRDAGSCVGAF